MEYVGGNSALESVYGIPNYCLHLGREGCDGM